MKKDQLIGHWYFLGSMFPFRASVCLFVSDGEQWFGFSTVCTSMRVLQFRRKLSFSTVLWSICTMTIKRLKKKKKIPLWQD